MVSAKSGGRAQLQLQQLDMKQGECFLFAQQEGQLVSSDIRLALRQQCSRLAVDHWRSESKHAAYACDEVKELYKQISSEASSSLADRKRVRFALALLTDSAHYYRQEDELTGKVQLLERRCSKCTAEAVANVEHVLTCDGRKASRDSLLTHLISSLQVLSGMPEWLRVDAAGLDSLVDWISCFFDGASASEIAANLRVRWCFGGFTQREFRAALQRIGCTAKKEQWQPVCFAMRTALFEWARAAFNDLS